MREESKNYDVVSDRQLLDTLLSVSAVLLDGHTPGETLRLILRKVTSLGLDRVRFYLTSDDGKSLRAAAHAGMGADFEGLTLRPGGGDGLRAIFRAAGPSLWRRGDGLAAPLDEPHVGETVAECAYLPLRKAGQLCGLLSADNSVSSRPVGEGQLRLLSLFAPHLSAAVECDTLAESERRTEGIRSVMRLYSTLNHSLNVEQVFEAACQAAIQLTGTDHGSLIVFEDGMSKGGVRAEYPRLELSGSEIPLQDIPAVERLLCATEPVMVEDVASAESLGMIRETLVGRGVRSSLFIPVVGKYGPLGAFSVNTLGRSHAFTDEEVEVCRMLAAQVAVGVEHARLAASEEARLRKLELLSRAACEFLSDVTYTDLSSRLALIARYATEILDAEVCGVFRVDEEGLLRLEASYGQREDVSVEPVRLRIHREPKNGLTGFIAGTGKLFNAYGDELLSHPAVRGTNHDFIPSGECMALLAIPLMKNVGSESKVVGLLRVTNKRGEDGTPRSSLRFTEDDEWVLKILAEAVVIAIDNTAIVAKLKAQRDDLNEQKHHLTKVESRLALLLKAGEIVAQADGLEEGLQNLSEMIVSLLSHTFCRIHLLDEDGTALVTNGAHSIARADGPFRWEPRPGARTEFEEYPGLQEFLDEGLPRVISWSDAEMRPHLQHLSERLALDEPVREMLMVPLKIDGEVIGLLNVGECRRERSAFTEESVELASSLAAQIGILVRRLWHYERRRTLLVRLGNAAHSIMAKYDREKIYQETVTLAVGLAGYAAGGLFKKQRQGFELCAEYRLNMEVRMRVPNDESGLLAEVARTGESRVVQHHADSALGLTALAGFGFQTVIAVPLKRAGETEAVLAVGERTGRRISSEAELEVLERFAEQASIALQTSTLVSREQLMFKHLEVLHQISDYIMSAQDVGNVFDAVLTGVTANYGLGFNRACIFLLDELQETLVGEKGIGHLNRSEAVRTWEAMREHGDSDFKVYVNSLAGGAPPETPLNAVVAGMRLPIEEAADDLFTRAVRSKEWVCVNGEFDRLPKEFRDALNPTSPLLIVPLSARGQPIGLLVADNEFTRAPINDDDIEALMTFANTATMAVENIKLFKRIQEGRQKLRMLFTASTALSTSREPRQVLDEIVEQTRVAARAESVEIILGDELGRSQVLIRKGAEGLRESTPPPADEGGAYSTQLLRPGAYHLLEGRGEPRGLRGGWSDVICCQQLRLPLSLHGKSFGVMSIHYAQPRTFTELEIDALQLYVNHAAVAYDSARRMDKLKHMREAAEALASAADARGVLRQIVHRARAALQADSAAIWIYDAARNSFAPEGWVASHISGELRKEFWKGKPRASGTAYTIMERGWVAVDDVSNISEYPFLGENTRNLLYRIGVHSFIGVSLAVGDEPLGVLYVNFGRPRHFGEEDQQTARTFANHAALALKKARLLEQVTKAKKAAEAVARVTVLENRDNTLQSVAEETQRALDCDIVMLFEYDIESKTLGHPPTMVGLDGEGRRKAMQGGEVDPKSVVYWVLEQAGPYIVEQVERDPMFRNRRFAREERIKSCVAIPIRMQEKNLGVMFVNYRTARRFTPDELSNMGLFANQAAVAIRNAQLFEARNLRLRQNAELLKFSEGLLGVVSLQETMDRAVRIAADILDVDCCAIVMPEEGGDLVIRAAHGWPPSFVGKQRLNGGHGSQSGLTIKSRAPVAVEDYWNERRFDVPDFIFKHGIRSGLSAPMFVGGDGSEEFLIGIMLVHSKSPRFFSEEDQTLLGLIANDTAVAIQRTRQYEELKLTRWRIGARTALAWMGMVNNYYQHTIVGHGNTINSRLELIRAEERKKDEKLPAWVGKHLDEIGEIAWKIVERPITPPLSSEEGLADLHLNELISERLSQLWARSPYSTVRLVTELDQSGGLVVRISPEWLRRALDVLVDNAVEEMQHVAPERRELRVSSRRAGEEVMVLIADRGRGLPKEVEEKIFKGKIEKQADAKGLGMGLLMAQAIIETYGGSLEVMETNPGGTTMRIRLPLAPKKGKANKVERA
jgi:GAF domain-containing protein